MSIFVLPPELMLWVADYLQPEDVFNLSLASQSLAYLIRFTALCRRVLMAQAPYSPEALLAQEGGDYTRGLRALVKRRNAIRRAEPFHVAFLGVGTSFMYTNGVLCYATDRGLLRLLDIRNSADHEIVVDVFQMLHHDGSLTVPEFTHHKLKPLHYGHGILTCELSLKGSCPTSYLIVIKLPTPKLLLVEEHQLHDKTLVETTDKYLFLCHPLPTHLWNYWGVRQFDIETGKCVQSRSRITSQAARKDNCVTCAVHEDYFYAVSSRDPLVSIRLPSAFVSGRRLCFYHAVRTPLADSPGHALEANISPSTWAQSYSGHMSDDRWNFLRLERDEGTGWLMAIQIRMEYPERGPYAMRTCIKRVLAFQDNVPAGPAISNAVNDTSTNFLGNRPEESELTTADGVPVLSNTQASHPKTTLHHGDSSLSHPYYGIAQCFVRSYFSTSNSFVDLVNDTLRHNGQTQSLRLRVMTEIPGGGNETAFWPPKNDPLNPDPRLRELHRIMNPPGFDGSLEWDVDSGSFAYGMRVNSNSDSHQKAIIYVGFDPTVKLHNLKAFHEAKSKGVEASGQSGSDGNVGSDTPTQGKANTGTNDEAPRVSFPSLGVSWAWMEEPLYFRPRGGNGFDFFG